MRQIIIIVFFRDYNILMKCARLYFIYLTKYFLLPKSILYSVSYGNFLVNARFLMKLFRCKFFALFIACRGLAKKPKVEFLVNFS